MTARKYIIEPLGDMYMSDVTADDIKIAMIPVSKRSEDVYNNLIYAGIDPKTVQYLAGHENSKVTMDIYAKAKYNKPEELSSVVNGALKKPGNRSKG